MADKLLTVTDVARYLNLSEKLVEELVEKGELPAYRVGGSFLRFKKEQIENYRKRSDSAAMAQEALFKDRGVKNAYSEKTVEGRLFAKHRGTPAPGDFTRYAFWEKLEDFLYYNDFYILSFILLVLILLAVFRF